MCCARSRLHVKTVPVNRHRTRITRVSVRCIHGPVYYFFYIYSLPNTSLFHKSILAISEETGMYVARVLSYLHSVSRYVP